MIKSKTGKVLFKDIVRSCAFKKVKDALLKHYPDQKKNIKGYKYVFETLRLMRPRDSKEEMIIDIRRVGRGRNAYFDVSGMCKENGKEQSYGIEYTPWSKWLGYEINKKVLKKMTKEEIAAHCLWEMTFAGFTQDKIRRQINMLRKRVKDIKEGKAKLIPYEEVMAGLKERTKGDKNNSKQLF